MYDYTMSFKYGNIHMHCKYTLLFAKDLFGKILRPSLNRKSKYPANIIHAPR